MTGASRKVVNGSSASAYCAATRRSWLSAAIPASWSPLRSGVAAAISAARVGNVCRSPVGVEAYTSAAQLPPLEHGLPLFHEGPAALLVVVAGEALVNQLLAQRD